MPTSTRKPSPYEFTGSAELNATVERVAPAILWLLADGVPRPKAAIVEALAGRHERPSEQTRHSMGVATAFGWRVVGQGSRMRNH
jgi:hypothetical protein